MMLAILDALIFSIFSCFQLYETFIYDYHNLLLAISNLMWSLYFNLFVLGIIASASNASKKVYLYIYSSILMYTVLEYTLE